MDTGDYPLVSAGLPGCPYRFTSYTAPPVVDVSRGMCKVIRSFLWELSGSCGLERDTWMFYIESKACCVNQVLGGLCSVDS